jgi:hypothetical protein
MKDKYIYIFTILCHDLFVCCILGEGYFGYTGKLPTPGIVCTNCTHMVSCPAVPGSVPCLQAALGTRVPSCIGSPAVLFWLSCPSCSSWETSQIISTFLSQCGHFRQRSLAACPWPEADHWNQLSNRDKRFCVTEANCIIKMSIFFHHTLPKLENFKILARWIFKGKKDDWAAYPVTDNYLLYWCYFFHPLRPGWAVT